ncbi:hypothetical protein [uncultured Friedmanniella sp.]|uniref:hypothetical protein n=1 Tax=uncultured Friedmanniella sp. TaxID=335381 RepID=UPI0035CB9EAB
MTTTVPSSTTDPVAQPAETAETAGLFSPPLRTVVSYAGGAAMLATPLLIVGGILTSPPQASRAMDDYVESLARDPFLSSLSASLLHYGWVTLALGLLVAMTLVRGSKGRVLTLVGGLVGGFAAVQMSALMLNDYFLTALGNNLALGDAVKVANAMMVDGDVASQLWWQSGKLVILLPVLLYAGLARAGVISWWLVPLSALPMVLPYLVMGWVGGASDQLIGGNALGLIAGGLTGLVCYAPTFLVGLRLLGRGRLTA